MKRFAVVPLLLGVLLGVPFSSSVQGQEFNEQRDVRLLFVGSSSMYWNDLPDAVAAAVDKKVVGHEGQSVAVELAGRSGDDIRVYLEPGFNRYQYGIKPGQTFLEKLRDENFDVVAMMVFTRFITESGESFDDSLHAVAVTQYCDAIRQAGGEPMFYESGWGQDERTELGRKRILELAKSNQVKFYAPCSSAWERVRSERPDMKLQHPNDSVHPGDLGHFLNVACFYAALTRTSPVGKLPRTYPVWHHLNDAEKKERKDELAASFANFQPSTYQAGLPKWMREYAGAGLTNSLSDEDATYLETVAWETWQQSDDKLDTFRHQ